MSWRVVPGSFGKITFFPDRSRKQEARGGGPGGDVARRRFDLGYSVVKDRSLQEVRRNGSTSLAEHCTGGYNIALQVIAGVAVRHIFVECESLRHAS